MVSAFAKILSTSIVANWLILAVLLLRLLLKKAPRRVICILWAIVAVRLLLPVSLESPVDFIPETTSAIQEAVDTNLIHPETVTSHTGTLTPPGRNQRCFHPCRLFHSCDSSCVALWRFADAELPGAALCQAAPPGSGSGVGEREYLDL